MTENTLEEQIYQFIKEKNLLKAGDVCIAELNSDMEIKQAEAGKKAAIGRNEAQKEVALSNSELAVTQANADKQAGEAAARSEAAVQAAREIAQKEVEEAKAKKVEY